MMQFWNDLNTRSKAFVSMGVAFFGILIMGIAAAFDSEGIAAIGGVIVLAGLGVRALGIHCPHCGHLLGRDLGEYCPHCGKELDRGND